MYTDVYINWNSHAPMQWNIDTLKNLVKRSINICSHQHLLWKELDYLRKVFVEINDCSSKAVENIINDCSSNAVENIIKNELEKGNLNITNQPQTNTTDNSKIKLHLFLPFSGKQGIQLFSKMKKQLKKSIPSNWKPCINTR